MLLNHLLLQYCVRQLGGAAQVKLEELNAGEINKSYCLHLGTQRFLVKQFTGNRWIPTKRDTLFHLQAQLAQQGVAAQPVHLSDDKNIYIEQWIEGDSLTHCAASQSEHSEQALVDGLCEHLMRIHSLSLDQSLTPLTDLTKHWQRYLRHMHDPDKKWQKKAKEYTAVWRSYENKFGKDFVLCHNDLNAEHILLSKTPRHSSYTYLDWEYAGIGCRFFDLITCGLANHFSQSQMDKLTLRFIELSDYHRAEVLQRVEILKPLVIFTHQLWWQTVQYQINKRQTKK